MRRSADGALAYGGWDTTQAQTGRLLHDLATVASRSVRAPHARIWPSSVRSQERVHDLGCTDEFWVDPWSEFVDVPKEMIVEPPPRGWEGR